LFGHTILVYVLNGEFVVFEILEVVFFIIPYRKREHVCTSTYVVSKK